MRKHDFARRRQQLRLSSAHSIALLCQIPRSARVLASREEMIFHAVRRRRLDDDRLPDAQYDDDQRRPVIIGAEDISSFTLATSRAAADERSNITPAYRMPALRAAAVKMVAAPAGVRRIDG